MMLTCLTCGVKLITRSVRTHINIRIRTGEGRSDQRSFSPANNREKNRKVSRSWHLVSVEESLLTRVTAKVSPAAKQGTGINREIPVGILRSLSRETKLRGHLHRR
jgi:hypothetical protein